MKKLLFIMMMCFAWVGMTSAMSESGKKDNDAPSIEFKSVTHDFGTIKEKDGKVSCTFTFTNKGKAPLVIISANASCGCTKPEFDEAPIAPGKSSTIKVTYNPKGRPGEFFKNINLRTNDPKHKKVNLSISGTVVPEAK